MLGCSPTASRGGKTLLADYIKSDEDRALGVPPDDRLQRLCSSLEEALQAGEIPPVHNLCQKFLNLAADFYKVERLPVRVLAARPVRSREGGWGYELFGDYHPDTMLIRVWMRTAVQKRVTSYGTFLSTLTHEFATTSITSCSTTATVGTPAVLRARRSALPPRARHAAQTAVLDKISRRALED